ncbi:MULTISPECIES: DUF1997 domain-containing protein [Chlorobium/Pelodictyon group]|jgi:hypothetical protein|nr:MULTISPECIES: DUF1997 domain-containing protein [Chlorobium/Pelodictyon group]ACF44892.1 conserved hypothetical protein [Pelodictyon phaeoclathratiforme BU-1]MBV5327992.1 DUF1997 domain-containing protein [Chlorobium sp.]
MEVVGKSKALVVLESCLQESTVYFSNHEKILKCNPYCRYVRYIPDFDVFQWTFEVDDPRNNPIVAIFFVRQTEEHIPTDSAVFRRYVGESRAPIDTETPGKKIIWETVESAPELLFNNDHTFIGKTFSEIFLLHQTDNRTTVHFETNISLDFKLSFPLNLMPEPALKFMSDMIMSKIMQQATESMLCQVQSDICCSMPEIATEGGKK